MKIAPPRIPSWYIARPRLSERLDEASERRLTLIVAGPGYGKTTELSARASERGWCWYTVDEGDADAAVLANGIASALKRLGIASELKLADAVSRDAAGAESLAASIATALDDAGLERDLALVLDDLHELGRDTTGAALVEGLVRYAPPSVHLLVGSRVEPPFPVARLRGSGAVLDLTSRDLAFSVEDVADVLARRVGDDARRLAPRLTEVTGGWPVAVYLASESLRAEPAADHDALVGTLAHRSDVLVEYLADEAIGRLAPEAVAVLTHVALLGGASSELLEGLGLPDAAARLAELARHGLVTRPTDPEGSYSLHALVRDVVLAQDDVAVSAASVQARAAAWHEERGELADALRLAVLARDVELTISLLSRGRAYAFVVAGEADLLLRAYESLPEEARAEVETDDIAHAYLIRGEPERAERVLERWAPASPHPDCVAVPHALLAIGRGDPRAAFDALAAAGPEPSTSVSAFSAYQLLALGRIEEADAFARRAVALAREDPRDAHEAYAAAGDVDAVRGRLAEAEELFVTALDLARRDGNVLAECAHLCRRSAARVQRGDARRGLELAVEAQGLADRIGSSQFQADAWTCVSRALLSLGRLDEAQAAVESGIASYRLSRSMSVITALGQLGRVHAERGELAQAEAVLARARQLTESSGAVALRVSTLATLARVVAGADPERAAELVPRVVPGEAWSYANRVDVLSAEGWIAVLRDDRETADRAASALIEAATSAGDHGAVAEGYALRAFARGASKDGIADLEESAAIWRRIGSPVAEARAVLALAGLGAADGTAVEHARSVLVGQAVHVTAAAAGLGAMIARDAPTAVAVRTFGRFAVVRGGREVAATAWQSRKARDLLKLLVCREGALVVRETLMEALWPEEDPTKTRNRLSVALNVVRGVLDPDSRHPPDWYVVADRDGIRLDLSHLDVDVVDFLGRAATAFAAVRAGDPGAGALLEAALEAHAGGFLEEDVHAEWAHELRERVRSAYADVLRGLIREEHSSDRFHLRLLALDPYDEDVHLDLVRLLASLGRHGEARRAYRRYASRMREIGVEPAPAHGLSAP